MYDTVFHKFTILKIPFQKFTIHKFTSQIYNSQILTHERSLEKVI